MPLHQHVNKKSDYDMMMTPQYTQWTSWLNCIKLYQIMGNSIGLKGLNLIKSYFWIEPPANKVMYTLIIAMSSLFEGLAKNWQHQGLSQKWSGLESPSWIYSKIIMSYRCVSDCRSRGREFNFGPVPYFPGDQSWNNFYSHSPPFGWFIQEGLLSVTSESMCTKYWLTACSSLPRKKCC